MKFIFKKSALAVACLTTSILAACGGSGGTISYPDLPSPPSGGGTIGVGTNDNFFADLVGDGVATAGCTPAVPTDGQVVKVSMLAQDKQGIDNAQAIYPNLSSNITYTFNGGSYTAAASNAGYVLPSAGTYDTTTGEILTSNTPVLADPMLDSFVTFSPLDWPQRLAKQLDGQPAGTVATLEVKLEARGYLPNLLANLAGGSPDPQNEVIQNTFTATALRINDGSVSGVAGACRFNFTLYRNFQWDPAVILLPGEHGAYGNALEITDPAVEDAALADITVSGDVLGTFDADRSSKLFLEPYMPALEGTFATSSSITFAPISVRWTHVYGISSLSFPTYLNTNGVENQRAVKPASAAAFQEFTYVP